MTPDESDGTDGLEARASARIGELLGEKYRLDRVLGFGGMATVYAATHRNGKEVALKLLHPEFTQSSDIRTRFLREGHVANQVKHRGAVSVLDDEVTSAGDAFLVMELLSGVTVECLWDRLDCRLHAPWVAAIVLQLLDVMAAAHEHGIIHRDLKPANLFLTSEGEVKVLDFGIARARAHNPATRTTNCGVILGTPAFMAPEQALGRAREIDERTDLWAVGALGFALLAGDVVHPGENTQETLVRAATCHARPLGPLAPDAPPSIVAVFDRALAFDRASRWQSAVAMRQALAVASHEVYGELPGADVLRVAVSGRRLAASAGALCETLALVAASATQPAEAKAASGSLSAPGVPAEEVSMPSLPPAVAITASGFGPRAEAGEPPSRWRRAHGRLALVAVLGAVALSLQLARVIEASAGRPALSAATGQATIPAPILAENAAATDAAASGVSVPSEGDVAAVATTTAAPTTASRGSARARASIGSSPPSSSARAGCSPPFTMDRSTGRKKWKLECL